MHTQKRKSVGCNKPTYFTAGQAMLGDLTWAKPVMVEVKDDGDIALETERQQVLHRESRDPVIILNSQPGFAVVTQAFKAHSKAVQCGKLVTIHPPNVNVDLVPVTWLEPHHI
jgi:hypothetical protein